MSIQAREWGLMPEEPSRASLEAITLALQQTAIAVDRLSDVAVRLRAENRVLTFTLAQVIARLSMTETKPHEAVLSLTAVAKQYALDTIEDVHESPAAVDGANDAVELLRQITLRAADAVVEEEARLRRWWLPHTWFW